MTDLPFVFVVDVKKFAMEKQKKRREEFQRRPRERLCFYFFQPQNHTAYHCSFQIRRLELERDQLLTTIEALKTRHKDELSNIDTAHK